MKPKSTLRSFLLIAGSALLSISSANASTLYWDGTDTDVDANGGDGTWIDDAGSTANWDDAATAGNPASWNNANNDTAVFGGALGNVTISGGVTVGGVQFDTAGYTVSGGTLTFGAPGSITANADATISSALAGASTITKSGTGTLILSAANAHTGQTAVNAGYLRISNATALGTTAAGTVVNSSGTLGAQTSITVTGESLNLSGTGSTGTNGALYAGGNAAFGWAGPVTLAGNTLIHADGGSSINLSGSTLNLGGNTLTFDNGSGANSTFSSDISNGSITKTLGGTLILSGTNNTFNGNTTLMAGTLQGTTASTSLTPTSPLGTSTLVLNGGTLQLRASGTLSTTAETITFGNNTTVGGDVTINMDRPGLTSTNKTIALGTLSIGANTLSVTGGNTYNLSFGTTTLTDNATFNLTRNLTLGAVGQSGGARSLTKSGAGTLTLSAANSHSGGTVVTAGNITLTGSGTLGSSGSTATFNVSSTLTTPNTVTIDQNIQIASGAVLSTASAAQGTKTFNGAVSGDGGITPRSQSSELTILASTANTFTGPIRLGSGIQPSTLEVNSLADSAGTIYLGPQSNSGSNYGQAIFRLGAGAIAPLVLSQRQFDLGSVYNDTFYGGLIENNNANTANTMTVNTDLLVTFAGVSGLKQLRLGGTNTGSNTFAGKIINGSATHVYLNKQGAGTWGVSGANTYTGHTRVEAGTLIANNITDGGLASSIGQSSASATKLVFKGGTLKYAPLKNTANVLTGGGTTSTDRNFALVANGSIDASGTGALNFSQTGVVSPDGGSGLSFSTTSGTKIITGLSSTDGLVIGMKMTGTGIAANSTIASIDSTTQVTLNNNATATGTPADGAFGYATARTLTLTGDNTGANTISGILQDSSAAGAGVLSVTKSGTGTWILPAANTYSGATVINGGGTLILSGSNSSAGNTTIGTGGGTLQLNSASNGGLASGTLNLNADPGVVQAINADRVITNSLIVQSNPTFSGNYSITAGNLRVNNADRAITNNIVSGKSLTVASVDRDGSNSRNLTVNGSGSTIVTGAVTLSGGSVTKNDAGTLTLNGANTYTGNTTVSAGTLVLADNAQLKFVLGATSGTNNSISGAGTVTLDGDFVIDTTAADALSSGTWTLENVGSLTGPYGSTFTVLGFTDAGSDKWTKDIGGGKTYTFDETTGILTLATAGGSDYDTWGAPYGLSSGSENGDLDGDGLTNFQEYAFGLIPDSGASVNPISQPLDKSSGLFKYTRRATPGTTGVTYTYESSTTLGAWSPLTPDSETSNSGSPTEEITVDVPDALLANPKLFIRVKASKP